MGASSSRGRVGEGEREPVVQGKPCLSVLITVPAACVAPLPSCSNEKQFICGERASVAPLTAARCVLFMMRCATASCIMAAFSQVKSVRFRLPLSEQIAVLYHFVP